MPKRKIILVSILIIFVIFLGISLYAFWLKSKILQVEIPPQNIEELLQPGTIGEIKEIPEGIPVIELPPVIFNTAGTITEIKTNRLIVQGSGSNFTDQKPRELTLIFTESTITFEPDQKVKYQGLEGLKHLKTGEEISISSPGNIRGKTQFIVDYINKI